MLCQMRRRNDIPQAYVIERYSLPSARCTPSHIMTSILRSLSCRRSQGIFLTRQTHKDANSSEVRLSNAKLTNGSLLNILMPSQPNHEQEFLKRVLMSTAYITSRYYHTHRAHEHLDAKEVVGRGLPECVFVYAILELTA